MSVGAHLARVRKKPSFDMRTMLAENHIGCAAPRSCSLLIPCVRSIPLSLPRKDTRCRCRNEPIDDESDAEIHAFQSRAGKTVIMNLTLHRLGALPGYPVLFRCLIALDDDFAEDRSNGDAAAADLVENRPNSADDSIVEDCCGGGPGVTSAPENDAIVSLARAVQRIIGCSTRHGAR